MTNAELIDLLREARGSFSAIEELALEHECDCPPEWARCHACRIRQRAGRLQRRIDAALAAHEAEVSFKHGVAQLGWLRLHTYGPNPDGTWTWSICLKDDDICSDATYATEDEAKAAAIAAARGLR